MHEVNEARITNSHPQFRSKSGKSHVQSGMEGEVLDVFLREHAKVVRWALDYIDGTRAPWVLLFDEYEGGGGWGHVLAPAGAALVLAESRQRVSFEMRQHAVSLANAALSAGELALIVLVCGRAEEMTGRVLRLADLGGGQ